MGKRIPEKRYAKLMRAQRARKGYCEDDTADIWAWCVEVLPGILWELAAKTDSYPDMIADEKFPGYDGDDAAGEDPRDEYLHRKWCDFLFYMAALLRVAGLKADSLADARVGLPGDAGGLNTDEERSRSAYLQCKDEFFRLFEKYFEHLWY